MDNKMDFYCLKDSKLLCVEKTLLRPTRSTGKSFSKILIQHFIKQMKFYSCLQWTKVPITTSAFHKSLLNGTIIKMNGSVNFLLQKQISQTLLTRYI